MMDALSAKIVGGAMIMKSVSLFLASGRRASLARRNAETEATSGGASASGASASRRGARRRAPPKMDAAAAARNANKLQPKTMELLRRKTHFNKVELEALYHMYRKLVTASLPGRKIAMAIKASTGGINKSNKVIEGIDRIMFKEILHKTFDLVAEETLGERIWNVWEGSGTTTGTGVLRLEPWLIGLSVFLKGTLNEKIFFCFRVYDLNSDGYLTKDEMFTLLRNSLLKQPGDEDPDEGVRELVELALKKIDVDQDGKVSFDDYRQTVTKEPLLLEAFGQCLPGNAECTAFLESLIQQ